MKLNKKLISLSAAAIMALSAVGASAASLPIPKDNNEAFRLAESFYYDGLYYEAQGELDFVNPASPYYDGNKKDAWAEKIAYKISRMEIATLLSKVEKLYGAGLYYEAAAVIDELNARTDTTQSDYYSIRWWEETVAKKIAELENKAVVVVRTGSAAINRVKAEGYTLKSEYEWYTPVKVGDHYDVYIQTQLPGGGYKDVAGFNVYVDGTVVRAF